MSYNNLAEHGKIPILCIFPPYVLINDQTSECWYAGFDSSGAQSYQEEAQECELSKKW